MSWRAASKWLLRNDLPCKPKKVLNNCPRNLEQSFYSKKQPYKPKQNKIKLDKYWIPTKT